MKESSVPTGARFTKPMIKRSDSPYAGGGKECVRATHNFKARWPTPQRGSWFPEEGDVTTFRQKLRNACPRDKEMVSNCFSCHMACCSLPPPFFSFRTGWLPVSKRNTRSVPHTSWSFINVIYPVRS